jgi:uncharacterized membrane protein YqjE
MFETIKKAKEIGALILERLSEYIELIKISVEIQGKNFKRRLIGYVVITFLSVLSLVFAGVAIIVTFWDTPYRVVSAWGVVAFYALTAFVVYFATPGQTDPASTFDTVRDELQQDIKLMKDIV